MLTDDLIERTATALAKSHGLDFDEVFGVDASPDDGYCDSGTCIASGYEDHDAAYARACYRSDARAAIAIIAPAVLDMAAKIPEKRAEERFDEHGVLEYDTNATYYSGRAAELFESLDEEDEAIRDAILALKAQFETETQV